jgi:hypothetical protein
MEFRNGNLLQLVECIESTQNEVKRKMIEARACNVAPKSPQRRARDKNCGDLTKRSHFFFCRVVVCVANFQNDARCGSAVAIGGSFSKALVQIDFQDHAFQFLLRLIALRFDIGDFLAQNGEAVLLRVELGSVALD